MKKKSFSFAALILLSALPLWAAAEDDSGCKIVLDALAKLGQTPNRQYIVVSGGAAGGMRQQEIINVGEVVYIKVQDQWKVAPMSPKRMAEQQQENIRSAKVYNCRYERDEKVDGEMTVVYKAHSENEDGIEEAEFWISKTRGLPLRQTAESSGTGTHMSARFVYTNVKAPEVK